MCVSECVCVCVDEWVNECVWVDLVEEQDSQQVLLLLRNKNVCIRYGWLTIKLKLWMAG